jgi:hypothetical protein
MYTCGAKCNGIKATASDPLAMYLCPLFEVHSRAEGKDTRSCYEPRPIDEETYHVVQEEYQEWAPHGEEEWVDFISEEATFTKSTWDHLVQRQKQIQQEKEA